MSALPACLELYASSPGPEELSDILKLALRATSRFWEPNRDLLQEQQGLLTAEPELLPQVSLHLKPPSQAFLGCLALALPWPGSDFLVTESYQRSWKQPRAAVGFDWLSGGYSERERWSAERGFGGCSIHSIVVPFLSPRGASIQSEADH